MSVCLQGIVRYSYLQCNLMYKCCLTLTRLGGREEEGGGDISQYLLVRPLNEMLAPSHSSSLPQLKSSLLAHTLSLFFYRVLSLYKTGPPPFWAFQEAGQGIPRFSHGVNDPPVEWTVCSIMLIAHKIKGLHSVQRERERVQFYLKQ